MIRTFTLNPAVDVSLVVDELVPIHKIRALSSTREAGGGGVNVTRLLVRLGAEVEAVVAVGGSTGAEITAALAGLDVAVVELDVCGSTRESLLIQDTARDQRYRIVVDGPPLCDRPDRIIELTRSVRIPEVTVFSGSLPSDCPTAMYADLSLIHPETFTIVDTSGAALEAAIFGFVDLIKPSLLEMETLVDRRIENANDLQRAVDDVLKCHENLGAVLVSLGQAGAVLGRRKERAIRLEVPEVSVVSAVGAGDSVVAGVAWGVHRGEDLLTSCRLGIAAGTATVATPGSALCSASSALSLLDQVTVSELGPNDPIR